MVDAPLFWIGSAQRDLRAFPKNARRLAGYQLQRVQAGLMPSDWKPMKTIGHGVNEIRIRTGLEHRVLYIVHRGDAVYVLHAYEKRTQKTRRADIELARQRLAEVQRIRSRRGK